MLKKIIVGFIILSINLLFAMTLNEVNSASKSELMQIKGIGTKKALKIINARNFRSYNDILKVRGIGKKLLSNIKNDVKLKRKSRKRKKSN